MAATKPSREVQAAEALERARHLAREEASWLGVHRDVVDPDSVASLAAFHWLRSQGRTKVALSTIVARRMIDELRFVTGFRKTWGFRHVVETVSFEQLRRRDSAHVFEMAAPAPGPDRHVSQLLAAIAQLELTRQERQALELMLAHGSNRKDVAEAMGLSETRVSQLVQSIRKQALAAGLGPRKARGG